MIKTKYKKNLAVALLVVGVLAGAIYTNVKAANTTDTSWSFSVFGDAGTNYTEPRTKTDASPAYSNVQSYNGKSDDYLQMYLVDSNKGDFHTRIVKTISSTGQYSVSSYAYEDKGRADVRMAFYAPYRYFYSWSASGVWSPDSTRVYN